MVETVRQLIYGYVRRRITAILSSSDSRVRAELANLRRGIGKAPGDIPELWGAFLCDMPEALYGKSKEPSKAEWAVYTSLTLFALHQQGHDVKTSPMHKEACPLGQAIRRLIPAGTADTDDAFDRILTRFNSFATSLSVAEMSYHLRGLVQLLKSENIPLDYADLACDIYRFQFPQTAPEVRLKWGRDFYRIQSDSQTAEASPSATEKNNSKEGN